MMERSLSDRDAEVRSELEVIKSMIGRVKESTADNSIYLILWGWLAFAGSLATYAFVYFRLYGLIWTAWAGVVSPIPRINLLPGATTLKRWSR